MQRRMIPMGTGNGISGVSTTGKFILNARSDEFCLRKRVVVSHMVYVEMGANENIDVVRMQTKRCKLFNNIRFVLGQGCSLRRRIVRRQSSVDQNVLAITHLNEIRRR